MNISNYIRVGNTIFGNHGTTRFYITPQQRRYRSVWEKYRDSHFSAGLNAAGITLDEAKISFETLREICDQFTGAKKCDSYIMPTKTDLMEFLQKGDEINNDTKLDTSRYR